MSFTADSAPDCATPDCTTGFGLAGCAAEVVVGDCDLTGCCTGGGGGGASTTFGGGTADAASGGFSSVLHKLPMSTAKKVASDSVLEHTKCLSIRMSC